jgi:hypothetical protein
VKEEPRLIIVGKPVTPARACAPFVVFLVFAAGFFTSAAMLLGVALIGQQTWEVMAFGGGPLVAAAVAFATDTWLRRSEGRTAFYDDRIAMDFGVRPVRGPAWFEAGWNDVRVFDDGAAEYVRLLVKTGHGELWFSVPTLREEDRVAVLALLDEKGVRREG